MSDCTDECDLADICSQRHWSIYWLIIVCSFLFVVGRIISVGGEDESPFMSANDRSRWMTIRSLGDNGRYEVDDIVTDKNSHINWDSIDKVQHLGRDGRLHAYSSKPALLPTLIAGVYVGLKVVTPFDIRNDTLIVARILLLLVNAVPWLIYLWLLGKTLELVQIRDWSRYYIVTVAGFGTFLSTFAITLNNHLPAAVCVMATLYGLIRIVNHERRSWAIFALTGLTAGFAAANELPALAWCVGVGIICLLKAPGKFVFGFLPAVGLVAAAFFATNFLAHADWRPPYLHKCDGRLIATVSGPFAEQLDEGKLPKECRQTLANNGFELLAANVSAVRWPFDDEPDLCRWKIDDAKQLRFTIVSRREGEDFRIHAWDNWYDYEGSYWTSGKKSMVDQGQNDSPLYLFHILFGHHGIFSLTPVWLLSLAGLFALVWSAQLRLRWLAVSTLAVSCIVIGFYVFWVPGHDRNYGGFSSGFRWAFWLAPLWLICMAPVVDWLGKTRNGRAFCAVLLAVSAISAMYSVENPWVHPWLYEIWDSTGLPK